MKRIFLKLSGEALAGDKKTGFDEDICRNVAMQVRTAIDEGGDIRLGVVIGGGNFWRGRTGNEIERTKSDQIGMLATIMNAIYVSEIFRGVGLKTRIFTPFACGTMTTLFSKDAAEAAFAAGEVCFFAGGTGHPYFSTDTGIALRAIEMEADCILLAKNIDGVYDSDPMINPNAKKFETLTLSEVVEKRLGVIDLTASIMCLENKIPLAVFSLKEENSIANAMLGNINGTIVTA